MEKQGINRKERGKETGHVKGKRKRYRVVLRTYTGNIAVTRGEKLSPIKAGKLRGKEEMVYFIFF